MNLKITLIYLSWITNNHLKVILSYFIVYILSSKYKVNQDGETCEDAPLSPDNYLDCTRYNTEETACCFAKVLLVDRTTENRCIPVKKNARFALNYLTIFSFNNINNEAFNDVTAEFEFGQEEGLCGMDSPEKLFQCSEHSSTTKSCCYLSTPTYTECILSSEKYNKETKFELFGSSSVVCNSNNLKLKKYNKFLYFIAFSNLFIIL